MYKKQLIVSLCGFRDEQIKSATARLKGRIAPHYDMRPDPIAVVCYGPSLADTWEEVKNFKYVISCSGSHKFLIDHGIIPNWHCEVDPRPHKVQLIGQPHKDVEYFIASTCCPKVFDHLEGFTVKLWHVFDNTEEAMRVLPHGEWALTGGCSVGLRALTIARFLGFTDLHIFGMDGSSGNTGKHAAEHPNQSKGKQWVDYNGFRYETTSGFLAAAQNTWHELNQMPDVKCKFYGEGLVQHMAKNYVPKYAPINKQLLGFAKPELISSEYRELNSRLHQDNFAYGVGGGKHADTVLKLAQSLMKADVKQNISVLDYGCGKGYLAKALPFPIAEFDPAIVGKDESPRPADVVVCSDVLEHIEADKLIFVLDDLRRCVKQVGYFIIHTGPSSKLLADGRNTHLIQQNAKWWRKQLEKFFTVPKNAMIEKTPLLYCIVAPKKKGMVTVA